MHQRIGHGDVEQQMLDEPARREREELRDSSVAAPDSAVMPALEAVSAFTPPCGMTMGAGAEARKVHLPDSFVHGCINLRRFAGALARRMIAVECAHP